jgi:iron complex outermembrane receptor protein
MLNLLSFAGLAAVRAPVPRSVKGRSLPERKVRPFSLSLGSILAITMALVAQPARAQSMNYGALEELFGEPVTTAATGTPQRVSEAPANMTIITADDIRRSGSRNIPEILSRVPGLDVMRSGLSAYDIGVRGYQQATQPRMLVVIDGRQVFLDDYSRTDWSNLPVNIDDIRQIEVVKGASSALFGSNAASGVINIVTYNPAYDDGIVVNGTLGTQHQRTIDATATLKGAWGGIKLSAGGLEADEFRTPRSPFDGNITPEHPDGTEPPKHRYVSASSVLAVADNLHANAELTYTRSISNFADNTDFNIMGVQHDKSYSARAGLNWDSQFGAISTNAYLNHTFVRILENGTGEIGFGTKMNLFVFNLQDQFKLGTNHIIRVGAEYRYRDYKQYNLETIIQHPHLVQNFISLSGTWLWQINDKIAFSNAIRFDHETMRQAGEINTTGIFDYEDYRNTNDAISANSTLTFNFTNQDHFRISYGRGVMLPSLIQNGYSQIVDFGFPLLLDAEGNPLLKSTIVQDLSTDYSRRIDSIFSTVKTSLFYEWSRNITAPFLNGATVIINGLPAFSNYAQNVGASHGWGGEVQLQGNHPSGIRWDASYSYVRVTDGSAVKTFINYQGSTPRHHLRLVLGYSTGPWEFDGSAHYVTSTDMLRNSFTSTVPVHTGGYASLSGRIGYRFGDRYTVALSGTNLSQRVTQVSAFPAVERQVLVSLTGRF